MVAPNTRLIATIPLSDRLLGSRRISSTGCWEWTMARTEHGYGRMSYQDHVRRTHRLAAHEWLGLALSDTSTKVCHTCDNPPCFNPDHLYLGDQKTNVADMVTRGRGYPGPDKWTHCAKGHEISPQNTVGKVNPRCRTCHNDGQRNRYVKRPTITALDGVPNA